MHREYLFDMTWYGEWEKWSQPVVIIEHENKWNHDEFLIDHWKLMMGFAPLRVSFGYARSEEDRRKLAASLHQMCSSPKWVFPSECEDLVFLGYREMPSKRSFMLLHRPRGQHEFRDDGELSRLWGQ